MPPKAPANSSNSEILQDWGDYVPSALPAGLTSAPSAGPYTFERNRLEKAVQYVCTDMAEKDRAKEKEKRAQVVAAAKKVKKEDVAFLTSELLLSKSEAESVLQECEGSLGKALQKVIVS